MKRAVISGATGTIGLALIEELISNNTEVLVLLNKNSNRNDRVKNHPLVKKVICSMEDMKDFSLPSKESYDVFYHFAWAGASGPLRNDMDLQLKNVQYALDAVRLAKRLHCKTFVGAGSQAEYGITNEDLTKDTPTFPVMGYGYAKLTAGLMTRDLCSQLDISHVWVRILSVYGPNDGENTLISAAIKNLKENVPMKTTRGEQIWDYLYSKDAGRALYLLGEKGVSQKTYVLGSGNGRPLSEYLEIIKKLVNPSGDIRYGEVPYAKNQVMHLVADISDLKKDTGFLPETDFETGIRSLL